MMFNNFASKPVRVKACRPGDKMSDLFRVAAAIIDAGGYATVQDDQERGASLQIRVEGRKNMVTVQKGWWVLLYNSGRCDVTRDDDFREIYEPETIALADWETDLLNGTAERSREDCMANHPSNGPEIP